MRQDGKTENTAEFSVPTILYKYKCSLPVVSFIPESKTGAKLERFRRGSRRCPDESGRTARRRSTLAKPGPERARQATPPQ